MEEKNAFFRIHYNARIKTVFNEIGSITHTTHTVESY